MSVAQGRALAATGGRQYQVTHVKESQQEVLTEHLGKGEIPSRLADAQLQLSSVLSCLLSFWRITFPTRFEW